MIFYTQQAEDGGMLEFYNNANCTLEGDNDHEISYNEFVPKSWLNEARTVYIKALPDGIHSLANGTEVLTITATPSVYAAARPRRTTQNIEVSAVEGKVGVYQFTMPEDRAINVSITASFPTKATNTAVLKYMTWFETNNILVDEEKAAGTVYILDGTETEIGVDGGDTWYLIPKGLAFTADRPTQDGNYLDCLGNVNIILADEASMNIGTETNPFNGNGFSGNGSISIYGQSMVEYPDDDDNDESTDLVDNRGQINFYCSDNGITTSNGSITLTNAKIKVVSTTAIAICNTDEYGDIDINGGQVEVTAQAEGKPAIQVQDYGKSYLRWGDASDFIKASSYDGKVTIPKGMFFVDMDDDEKTYGKDNGDFVLYLIEDPHDALLSDIAGKTLIPLQESTVSGLPSEPMEVINEQAPSTKTYMTVGVYGNKRGNWEISSASASVNIKVNYVGGVTKYNANRYAVNIKAMPDGFAKSDGAYIVTAKANDKNILKKSKVRIRSKAEAKKLNSDIKKAKINKKVLKNIVVVISKKKFSKSQRTKYKKLFKKAGVKVKIKARRRAPDTNGGDDDDDEDITDEDLSEYIPFVMVNGSFRPVSIKADDELPDGLVLLILPKFELINGKDIVADYWQEHMDELNGEDDTDGNARAYEIPVDFGAQSTSLEEILDHPISQVRTDAVKGWYSLDGRKLNQAPKAKGIYIQGGKKVVIK
ncbi:MAG: hypothetical protein K6G32_10865 [Prevotella sp.]|nr:hypothetical protein [Prevotella sp.]